MNPKGKSSRGFLKPSLEDPKLSFLQTERSNFLHQQLQTKSQNQLDLLEMIKIKEGPQKTNTWKKKGSKKDPVPLDFDKVKQNQIKESLQLNSLVFQSRTSNGKSSLMSSRPSEQNL